MFDMEKIIAVSVTFIGFYMIVDNTIKKYTERLQVEIKSNLLSEKIKLQEERITSLEDFRLKIYQGGNINVSLKREWDFSPTMSDIAEDEDEDFID